MFNFDIKKADQQLKKFRRLLDKHPELDESAHILPFFRANRHLAAMVGLINPVAEEIDRLAFEWRISERFRCDVLAGDHEQRQYTLLEFEDAGRRSIFKATRKSTPEWSSRYEHGFSQLVDWFWMLESVKDTGPFQLSFGGPPLIFSPC